MKNLLAKFYKSLTCRVAWALITTATAANAHDLPQHFPHAPTDWGMLQQDCLGYYDRAQPTFRSDVLSKEQLVEFAVAQPDAGNPPEPLAMISSDRDGSAERFGPALFDGVDCADLESFYRPVPSNEPIELTQESIELTQEPNELVQEPIEPTQESNELAQESIELAQESIAPTQESVELVQESVELVQESIELVQEPIAPTQESVELSRESNELVQVPIEPTQESNELTQGSIEPTQESVELAQESNEPAQEPNDLAQEPIELARESIELTQESIELSHEAIELVQEPIEQVQELSELTQEPSELVQEPIEPTQESAPEPAATQSATAESEYWEFHKSFYAACSCEFENRQANQSIVPPQFILKRTYIEDHFANELNTLKPLVLRELSASSTEPLAIAIPTQPVQDNHLLSDALSQLVSWDCVARSEFYSSQSAFQFGELTGSLAKNWITDTLPLASHTIDDFAHHLTLAQEPISAAPLFVIYTTAEGNEMAIPIAQARDWQQPTSEALPTVKAAVSQELQDLIELANLRLKWAGGRLSTAASLMNDWFSDRLARAKSDDLR